jgi:transposase
MFYFSGARLVYLPAYSPDFNPIEEGFSAMKAWIRHNYNDAQQALSRPNRCARHILYHAVYEAMTVQNAEG